MKKRVLAVLLATMLSVSMVACSNGDKDYSDVKWSKYVTLVDYKNISAKPEKMPEVKDEDVEKEIQAILASKGTMQEVKGRPVQNGDTVNIDYEGKKDGVAFEGGTAKAQDLTIGSGQFIPGFEEGLVGANLGQTLDLNLTFPKEYHNKELAGAKVVFTVKVNAIKETKKAELNDEFVKSVSQTSKTVDEFRKEIKTKLTEAQEAQAKNVALSNAWQNIIENSQVEKYPKGYVAAKEKEGRDHYEKLAKENKQSLEDYLKSNYNMTVKEFDKNIKTSTEQNVKQTAVLRALCEKEGITVTDKEYKSEGDKYASQVGLKSVEELEEEFSKDYIEEVILWGKVQQFLSGEKAETK